MMEDLAAVLAATVALATAIERFWETVFDAYESFARSVSKLAGVDPRLIGWVRGELARAIETITKLDVTSPSYLKDAADAEQRLAEAHARMDAIVKSPEYVALKRSIIILGSLALGVAISTAANLRFLHASGLPVPEHLDVILTGLIVGTGSGPVHTLMKTFEAVRSSVSGLALARSPGGPGS